MLYYDNGLKIFKLAFVHTESVRTISPFKGGKICCVDTLLNPTNCGK